MNYVQHLTFKDKDTHADDNHTNQSDNEIRGKECVLNIDWMLRTHNMSTDTGE